MPSPVASQALLTPRLSAGPVAAARRARIVTQAKARRGLGQAAPDALAVAVVAYLALPGFLFLAGWSAPWTGALAALAGLGALARLPRRKGPWPLPGLMML